MKKKFAYGLCAVALGMSLGLSDASAATAVTNNKAAIAKQQQARIAWQNYMRQKKAAIAKQQQARIAWQNYMRQKMNRYYGQPPRTAWGYRPNFGQKVINNNGRPFRGGWGRRPIMGKPNIHIIRNGKQQQYRGLSYTGNTRPYGIPSWNNKRRLP
ncbi:MAG: hypothetical protein D6732_17625 [Methanobacteriota archaeon]|nr:MAG: hypothetical protein D6732_17625 [Euryarchaeota archaeon]